MRSDLERHQQVLQARREGDVQTLILALDDKIEAGRAADFLGELGDAAAIPALISMLAAVDPYHRASAALSLGRLRACEACHRITAVAERDDVPWVRSCAATALGNVPCDSRDVLVRGLDDPDMRVRRASLMSLVEIGQPDVIPAIRAARRRERWHSRLIYGKAIRRLNRSGGVAP